MLPPKPKHLAVPFRGTFHQNTLIHEAAHAVLGNALDMPVSHIQIGPLPNEQLGQRDVSGFILTCNPDTLLRYWQRNPYLTHRGITEARHAAIIMFLSGAEAERQVLGRQFVGTDSHDRAQVEKILMALGHREEALARWHVRLSRQTRTLVRRHIPEILYVWKYLQPLTYPIVSGDELTELLRRAKMYG